MKSRREGAKRDMKCISETLGRGDRTRKIRVEGMGGDGMGWDGERRTEEKTVIQYSRDQLGY